MSLMDRLEKKGSLNNYFKEDINNNIQNLDLNTLEVISEQPFKEYCNSNKYQLLKESIKDNGITNPIIVWSKSNSNKYIILSGRHRFLVAKELNFETVPCIVKKNLSNDEANLILLDSNLCQREELLPSEKAWSYKQKLDILNRKGKRTDLINDINKGLKSSQILANELNTSSTEIIRMIRLTYLINELLNKLDTKKISIMVGYNLSFLSVNDQKTINALLDNNSIKISVKVSEKLKELSQKNSLDTKTIEEFLLKNNIYSNEKNKKDYFDEIYIKHFKSYFPKNANQDEVIITIKKALDLYFSKS